MFTFHSTIFILSNLFQYQLLNINFILSCRSNSCHRNDQRRKSWCMCHKVLAPKPPAPNRWRRNGGAGMSQTFNRILLMMVMMIIFRVSAGHGHLACHPRWFLGLRLTPLMVPYLPPLVAFYHMQEETAVQFYSPGNRRGGGREVLCHSVAGSDFKSNNNNYPFVDGLTERVNSRPVGQTALR